MKLKDIFRLAFAAALASSAAVTVLTGAGNTALDPNDPFYQGSICRHNPVALKQ